MNARRHATRQIRALVVGAPAVRSQPVLICRAAGAVVKASIRRCRVSVCDDRCRTEAGFSADGEHVGVKPRVRLNGRPDRRCSGGRRPAPGRRRRLRGAGQPGSLQPCSRSCAGRASATLTDQASNARPTMIYEFSSCCLPTWSPVKESAGQWLSPNGFRELIVRSLRMYPALEIDLRHRCV